MPLIIRPIPELTERDKAAFERRLRKAPGCWRWIGVRGRLDYGEFFLAGEYYYAHRVSYSLAHGVQEFGELDHLCRNSACVNPAHLEEVSHWENMRRGRAFEYDSPKYLYRTTCVNGHPVSPENIRIRPGTIGIRPGTIGQRICRPCEKEAQRVSRARRAAVLV